MERWIGLLGVIAFVFVAWLLSEHKKKVDWKLVLVGIGLQVVFALLILKTNVGKASFDWARIAISKLLSFSNEGSKFVFGEKTYQQHFFAFVILPTIIFVSSLTSILFHLGILQFFVKWMAKFLVKMLPISGSEALSASANVFIGQTEAPLFVKPYIQSMTRSEIMAMMTGGMATVSGSIMAVYASYGADIGHLLAASIMSAPASLVIAKIMLPELENSVTKGNVSLQLPKESINVLDAACKGAADGLKLALNVAAMLIAFIGLVYLLDWILSILPFWNKQPITLNLLFGWIMYPFAWLLGISSKDTHAIAALLGKKTILNELLAYQDLKQLKGVISERSFIIATYALCGFANFSSIAIQIGGIGGLAPEKREIFAAYGLKAMIGGSLAAFMTAAIAGILL